MRSCTGVRARRRSPVNVSTLRQRRAHSLLDLGGGGHLDADDGSLSRLGTEDVVGDHRERDERGRESDARNPPDLWAPPSLS